jgi:hypothetical protein
MRVVYSTMLKISAGGKKSLGADPAVFLQNLGKFGEICKKLAKIQFSRSMHSEKLGKRIPAGLADIST